MQRKERKGDLCKGKKKGSRNGKGMDAMQKNGKVKKGKERKTKGKQSRRGMGWEAIQRKGGSAKERKGKERRQQQSNLRHARTSRSVFTCCGLWSANEFDPG